MSKHLLASQAKVIYREYWDDYFKFSIVRDPYSRTRSLLRFADHFGLSISRGGIDFTGYDKLYGSDIVVEYDHRFHRVEEVRHERHRSACVYGNILDEEIDFIARFEHLTQDLSIIRDRLKVRRPFCYHREGSPPSLPQLTRADENWIESRYLGDFMQYGYIPKNDT